MKKVTNILLFVLGFGASFNSFAEEECKLMTFMWGAPTEFVGDTVLLPEEITRFNIGCNDDPLVQTLGDVRRYEKSMCAEVFTDFACDITVTVVETSGKAYFNEFSIGGEGPSPDNKTPKVITRLKVKGQ